MHTVKIPHHMLMVRYMMKVLHQLQKSFGDLPEIKGFN